MRRFFGFVFLIVVLLSGFFFGTPKALEQQKTSPQTLPISSYHPFVVILYAHNANSWIKRSLQSVFAQNYESFRIVFIDDASVDQSFEVAQAFLVENQLDHLASVIRNEKKVGFVKSLQEAAVHCFDQEIIVPLFATDWLSHDDVFSRVNEVFQNPDVWGVVGQQIGYPELRLQDPIGIATLSKKDLFYALYAGFFKSLIANDLKKLSQMKGERLCFMQEPLVVVNQATSAR